MRNLIAFFRRFKIFLIFTAFQIVALAFYFSQHTYPKNVFLSSTSVVTGNILSVQKDITNYMSLGNQNEKLALSLNEIMNREKSLFILEDTNTTLHEDTLRKQRYRIDQVHVISGGTKQRNNYFTIDAGINQGVEEGMGVTGPNGVIGFVTDVNNRFSLVKSLLCENININAMIAKNGAHGFLKWDGRDPNLIQLNEITNDTDIKKGDTIVTRGSASSFARGMHIGIVENVAANDGAVYLNIDVRIGQNLNQVYHAFLIKDLYKSAFISNKSAIKKHDAE